MLSVNSHRIYLLKSDGEDLMLLSITCVKKKEDEQKKLIYAYVV